MTLSFGGGAGVLTMPGVASGGDGQLIVTGAEFPAVVEVVSPVSTGEYHADCVIITRSADHRVALQIQLAAGSSGAELELVGGLGNTVWQMDADGTESLAGSLGINGVAAPGYPVLATGAMHTVDDVIALLQLYGFCKQS